MGRGKEMKVRERGICRGRRVEQLISLFSTPFYLVVKFLIKSIFLLSNYYRDVILLTVAA